VLANGQPCRLTSRKAGPAGSELLVLEAPPQAWLGKTLGTVTVVGQQPVRVSQLELHLDPPA
jgi:hypothetical protein